MKINLKDNIWIDGFDHFWQMVLREQSFLDTDLKYTKDHIYSGKTSEISEELAKECVEILAKTTMGNFYRNYQYNKPQPVSFTKCTAKESIQSACPHEYCIIYKTK